MRLRFNTFLVVLVFVTGFVSHSGTAHAEAGEMSEGDVIAEIAVGTLGAIAVLGITAVAAINLVSIVPSAIYLGNKKRSPIGWQVYGYLVGGLTFGLGLASALNQSTSWSWSLVGIGATTLTLNILAGTLNKPTTKPAVALAPVLIQDMRGHVTPGLGLSVLAF
jgi:hypothetical protein